jgi:hypothetical protein
MTGMEAEPTRLEEVFGFRNEAFGQYVHTVALAEVRPRYLMTMAVRMLDDRHPLATYAAGWAAAEAGQYAFKEDRHDPADMPSIDERLNALGIAGKLWRKSRVGFEALRLQSRDEHVAANMLGFELRARQSRAYLPTMRTIAQLRGGGEVSEASEADSLHQTWRNVINVGNLVLQTVDTRGEYGDTRTGIMNELISGPVLQRGLPDHYIVPASVRQDNHVRPSMRTDLAAIARHPPHRAIGIDVTSYRDRRHLVKRFSIYPTEDLSIGYDNALATFDILARMKQGGPVTDEEYEGVMVLAGNLGTRLLAAEAEKTRLEQARSALSWSARIA